MQFTCRLLRLLIQEPLVLFYDVTPHIRHSHLPAHHFLKIGIKLLGLPQIHHIVYGLCGKVVFDSLLLIVFPLNFRFFVAGLKLGMAFEEL